MKHAWTHTRVGIVFHHYHCTRCDINGASRNLVTPIEDQVLMYWIEGDYRNINIPVDCDEMIVSDVLGS